MICVKLRTGLAVLAVFATSLAGCTAKKGESPSASCLPACTGTRAYDAVAYALSARFDWTTSQLLATEEITLRLPAGTSPVVALDAAVAVKAVRAGSRALVYTAAANELRVDLGPLAPGTSPVTFTVEYVASASDSLMASSSVAEDPIRARVVFTDSEPQRGHQWLVQKDDPADPAAFSIELTVAGDEDLIANGERIADEVVAGGRRVAYAIDAPIATYLMAFAAGQLEHSDRPTGSSVPLSLWYRRGLALDPADTLDAVADAMASFEALLGPYPFARYAVVLVPGYGGGMENATITFEGERYGQGPYSTGLHTHELAHHWFGDWVTMHGYDDVWIKEGMATLLSAEANRARSDVEGRGRLMASSFDFDPASAIVDPTLTGLAKYTSGPYERSAALITQIRARIGEAAFWADLRGFLADHAGGSATGEQFVRGFSPHLTEPEIQQVLAILPQFDLPGLEAGVLPGTGTTQVSVTISDPTHLLLVPYGLTLVDAAGTVTIRELTAGATVVVDLPAGGYLAPDEGEVHPDYPVAGGLMSLLSPLFQPAIGTPPGDRWASRSASHQDRTLSYGALPDIAPGQFQAYYDALDSDTATFYALWWACELVQALPAADQAAWLTVLAPIFHAPRATRPSSQFVRCGPQLGATFLAEFQSLAAGATDAQLGRLEYLLWFDYGAAGLDPLTQVATAAPSLRLRRAAASRLSYLPPAGSVIPAGARAHALTAGRGTVQAGALAFPEPAHLLEGKGARARAAGP